MAKKRHTSKHKKGSIQFTKGKNIFKGFILTWVDPDPLVKNNQIVDVRVSHKNPILRPTAQQAWLHYGGSIRTNKHLLWKITVTAFYPYAKGTMEREEQIQIVERIMLDELAELIEPTLDALFEEGPNLDRVFFTVECLGARSKRPSDYDEGFAPEDNTNN